MLPLRSLFAGLMLAVVACGAVGAPLVHEAMHAAERNALRAEHAVDGHHTVATRSGAHVSDECPVPNQSLDLDCTLCHGLTAALVAGATSLPAPDPVAESFAARPPPSASATVWTPTGRGPPSA